MSFERLENLNGQVAVVTGANGGIGFAIVEQLAKSGARVVALVRKDVEKMQERLGQIANQHLNHIAVLADVTDRAQLDEAAKVAGQCDLLVNCAGQVKQLPRGDLEAITDDIFTEILEVNLVSVFRTIKAFMPLLQQSPTALVVNISSANGIKANPANISYSAAKAGVESLTKGLAQLLAPKVRVVSIVPAAINTGFIKMSPEFWTRHAETTPLKRSGLPEDIASAVEAVATSLRFATGNTILVEGGILGL